MSSLVAIANQGKKMLVWIENFINYRFDCYMGSNSASTHDILFTLQLNVESDPAHHRCIKCEKPFLFLHEIKHLVDAYYLSILDHCAHKIKLFIGYQI